MNAQWCVFALIEAPRHKFPSCLHTFWKAWIIGLSFALISYLAGCFKARRFEIHPLYYPYQAFLILCYYESLGKSTHSSPFHVIVGPCGFERVNGGSLPLSVLFMRRSVASCTQARLAVSSSVEVTHANELLSARLESKPWLTAELRENGTRAQSHLATRQPFLSNVRQLNTLNWEWVDIEDKGEEYKL